MLLLLLTLSMSPVDHVDCPTVRPLDVGSCQTSLTCTQNPPYPYHYPRRMSTTYRPTFTKIVTIYVQRIISEQSAYILRQIRLIQRTRLN